MFVVGLVDTIDTVFPLENDGRSCVYPLVLVQQLGDFAVPPQEAMFLQVYRRHPRAGRVFFCGIGCWEMESVVVEMELEHEKPKKLAMFAQKVAASDAEFLIMDNAPLPQRGAKN